MKVDVFNQADISPSDLEKAIINFRYEYRKKGSTIIEAGSKGDYFYIILHGQVEVHLVNPRI